jgi:MFS family permease
MEPNAAPPDRRPFAALMAANAIAQVGHMMTAVAVPWLVLETTGSATQVGLVGAAIAIGAVAPALLGGPLVDRLGLRRTSITADLICAATVSAIPLLQLVGVLEFWQLLLLVFILSSFNAQGDTGRFALIPSLATRAALSLERSNATDRAIARSGQLIGPLVAGALIPIIGAANVLLVDAVAFVVSASLVGFGISSAAAAPLAPAEPRPTRNYRSDLTEGLRFVAGNRLILSVILLCLVGNFFDLPLVTVVLPVYANEMFGSPQSLGLMLASLAAGTLAGTILFGAFGRRLPRRRLLLGGWLLVIVITYGALAAQAPLLVVVLAGLLGGLAAGPINPILETLVQENTPPQLMGRVFGAFLAFAQAGIPVGAAIAGLAIEQAGLIPTIATAGIVYVVFLALMFFNPALRGIDMKGVKGVTREPAGAEAAVAAAAVAAEAEQAQSQPQARQAATMKAGLR